MFLDMIYAAYGSNMSLKAMKERCPNAVAIGTGILGDTGIVFRGKDRGFATLSPSEGGCLPVVLWRITSECEKALDAYEEFPMVYEKDMVSVNTSNGSIGAMVYVMTAEYSAEPVLPSPHYVQVIKDGYDDHRLDFSVYQEALDLIVKET